MNVAPAMFFSDGKEIEVKLLHSRKADAPMDVTVDGMLTLARLLHPQKADTPMDVTVDGMVTLVRLLHPFNASSQMFVILPLPVISTVVRLRQSSNEKFQFPLNLGKTTVLRL